MIYIEIRTFADVILFSLQQRKIRLITFNELWKLCADAALHLPNCPPAEMKRDFARQLFKSLDELEKRGYVTKHTRGSYDAQGTLPKLLHITATVKGSDYLRTVVFTHQERMGKRPGHEPRHTQGEMPL